MVGLNDILAKVSPFFPRLTIGVHEPAAHLLQQGQVEREKDRFVSRQYWLNMTAAKDANLGGIACRCGFCPECAAIAYGKQDKQQAIVQGDKTEKKNELAPGLQAGQDALDQDPVETTVIDGTTVKEAADGEPLGTAEIGQLAELKRVDIAVRSHERAHLAAAAGLAKGAASFTYQRGPDGRRYAVGGEVQIDTSEGGTPEETVAKMMKVRAAALAPADPSPQDRKVAQGAAMTMSAAKLEIQKEELQPKEEKASAIAKRDVEQSDEGQSGVSRTEGEMTGDKSGMAFKVTGLYLATTGERGFFHLAV